MATVVFVRVGASNLACYGGRQDAVRVTAQARVPVLVHDQGAIQRKESHEDSMVLKATVKNTRGNEQGIIYR